MSRKIPSGEYDKTISGRLKIWLDGSKDPYLDNIEMRPACRYYRTDEEKQEGAEEMKVARGRAFSEKNASVRIFARLYRIFSVIAIIALLIILSIGVMDLPALGTKDRPTNNEVPERYIENGLQETGSVNIVTGMILDYRAFDTLGESHVLFVATCAVLILLRIDRKKTNRSGLKPYEEESQAEESKDDVILQTSARLLVPLIVMFGIYVVLCGHLGPGGGFSGGAVIGGGMILYLNAFGFAATEKFFNAKTYKCATFGALACYALCKSYSFFTGANHIHSIIPLGTPGAIISSGLILILNICVGIVVAGTMYTMYVMFRRGGY